MQSTLGKKCHLNLSTYLYIYLCACMCVCVLIKFILVLSAQFRHSSLNYILVLDQFSFMFDKHMLG